MNITDAKRYFDSFNYELLASSECIKTLQKINIGEKSCQKKIKQKSANIADRR